MDADMLLYFSAFAINSVVILIDLLVIVCGIQTGELRRHFVLQTIVLAMAMDIAEYLVLVFHDLPSFVLDVDFLPFAPAEYLFILINSCQWFTQLFVMLAISLIHLAAVIAPTRFRAFSSRSIHIINAAILLISILLTVPFFTPYFGFYYTTKGHFWFYDSTKPYSHLYEKFNLVLQAICVIVVATADIFVVWKIHRIRSSRRIFRKSPQSKTREEMQVSREMQLAVNFILLSACFLIMTTVFNLKLRGPFHAFILRLTFNLNLLKWSIYALGNGVIRRRLLSLFFCRQVVAPASIS